MSDLMPYFSMGVSRPPARDGGDGSAAVFCAGDPAKAGAWLAVCTCAPWPLSGVRVQVSVERFGQ
ncbi:hypothetical protein [Ottowia caeni]|uniref:hypothetical protein n=1 Tax=Ottowia caeni TaxID=2870339 RepID=UPI003D70E657